MRKIYTMLQGLFVLILFFCGTSISAQNKINSFPYTESFESGIGDWVQSTSDDFNWSINSGGTGSTGTGPNAAYDGAYYIYTEASSNFNNTSYLDASFDFSGLTQPVLSFFYHMYGVNMGSLHIDIWDGSWNLDILTITGQQQTGNAEPWESQMVDLTSYAGSDSVVVRLRGVTGSSFESDICIDEIQVIEAVDMTYTSSTVAQPITSKVLQSSVDNIIAVIEISTEGSFNPIQVDSILLNSNGSDNFANDVENVNVYYTGSDSVFSTNTLFGSLTDLTFPVEGLIYLNSGKNYFWVTYDVTVDAIPENRIDVECTNISFNDAIGDAVPTVTDPSGYRIIDSIMVVNTISAFTNDTSIVYRDTEDDEIFGFNINTYNTSNPLNLDSIKLNFNSSDNYTSDISSFKVYSTGASNSYNTTNLIWEGVSIDDQAIYIDQKLTEGDNFFWIAVDISSNAIIENKVQASCDYLIIGNVKYYSTIIEPYGSRTIKEEPKYINFMAADIVVGQPDFYTQNVIIDEYTGYSASSSDVSSKGVLAVGSQGAGRILIWNSVPDTNGTPADIVVGNPDFTSQNNGPSAEYVNNIESVCFSPDGNKLIASDGGNNRVLIWNSIPTTNGQAADVVIGQTDFTSSVAGSGPDKFNYPWGVFVTPDGKLIVGDRMNNRFLVFNQIPTTNGASADLVLGQPDMYTTNPGCSKSKMNTTTCATISPEGKLLLSDRGNHRVLIFNEFPTENGDSADIVIGQNSFVTGTSGLSNSTLNVPVGVTVSPKGEIAIGEFSNNRVLIYEEIPDTNGAPADYVLGQPDFNSNTAFNGGVNEKSMYHPYGINFDLNGRLYVNGRDMHRVMIYGDLPTDSADLDISVSADKTNPHIGEAITYTFTLSNNGPNNSTEIIVKSALPGLFKLDNYTTDKGEYKPYGGTWEIPYLASGESISLILDGTIKDGNGSITAYSNIVASSAVDSILSNNATSLTIDVINEAPTISDFDNDTIYQGTSTVWIPFTIGDTDTDMDKLELTAVSSDQLILPNTNIEIKGNNENRYIKATPLTDQSGAVDITVSVSDGYNQDQSTFELYILSNNANLATLDTTGTSLTGFKADSLTYTCELTAGTITAPTVTATAESGFAEVNIYETDTVPGITTIEVIAEDEKTIKTYLVTFVLPVNADNDASLIDLQVDGSTINGFSPLRYHYTKELPYGTSVVPTVNAIAKNASATVSLNQTTVLPGIDSILVTAVDGVTELLYTIEYIVNSASSNNNLQKITIDGEELVEFAPDVTSYTIEYPYGTSTVPMVIAIPEDANAFVNQTDASSMPGTTTLEVNAEDGSIKTYSIEFTLGAPSADATLSNIKIDGVSVFGFDAATYSYDMELDNSVTEVPEVTAIATHDSATIAITDAASIPGTTSVLVTAQDGITELTYSVNFSYEPLSNISLLSDLKAGGVTLESFDPNTFNYIVRVAEGSSTPPNVTATVYDSKATKTISNATTIPGTATVTVTAEDGSESVYSVSFTYDNLSDDATLSDISVSGTTVTGFDPATLTYAVELSYGTTVVPTVTAVSNDPNADLLITDAASLPGTTTVEVTAEDEVTSKTYTVNFSIANPSTDATLSDLKVDGTTVSGFSASNLEYNFELDYGTTTVPTVTAAANDANADILITDAASLPGTTTVKVTAEDGTTSKTYSVNFSIADPNTDATLSDLKVDGTTVSGFSSSIFSYDVELSSGTTTVPTVSATANDENAGINISDATDLPGTTTVTVTAEDETTVETYEINFTVATSIEEPSLNKAIVVYPNPTNGKLTVSFENELNTNWNVELYNSLGTKLYTRNLTDFNKSEYTFDFSGFAKGIYFIKIFNENDTFVKQLIIK